MWVWLQKLLASSVVSLLFGWLQDMISNYKAKKEYEAKLALAKAEFLKDMELAGDDQKLQESAADKFFTATN